MIYDERTEADVIRYAEIAETQFQLMLRDFQAFEVRLRAGLRFMGTDPYEDGKIELARHARLFSKQMFLAMISGGEPYAPMPAQLVWKRMVESGLANDTLPALPQGSIPLADHQLEMQLLAKHFRDQTFQNIMVPPSRLLTRYASAVASIDVMIGDDQNRGTAFVVLYRNLQWLVTCKHNVHHPSGLKVLAITSGKDVALTPSEWQMSDRYDLAVSLIHEVVANPCFALCEETRVFDEVFTLGYPSIPGAHSTLVGHRGEINGHVDLYLQHCPAIIISNLVAPGNSGGPVLDRTGRCIGMTMDWLEGQWQAKEMRYSAALPAGLIIDAIKRASTHTVL